MYLCLNVKKKIFQYNDPIDTSIMKYIFQCNDCKAEYSSREWQYLCPECSKTNINELPPKGVLKCVYDYPAIARKGIQQLVGSHFIDLYPIEDERNMPTLRIGRTPLYESIFELHGKSIKLYIKDDSQNPTFSFKDRASAMVSAYAKEHNIQTIVAASTGNAGSSIAGIAASQGQQAIVLVPAKAPPAKLTQILLYGAKIVAVDGSYDEAFDLSIEASKAFGWFNRNTAYNPLTIEGKKTVSFEIWEQMKGEIPDIIFVPAGDGAIISGVYKGFEELLFLGLIDRIPKIVAVQAEGSPNIVNNRFSQKPVFIKSNTLADSISVTIPRNYYMTQDYLYKYAGDGILVKDKEILTAIAGLASRYGLFAEPAAATAFAGMKKYLTENDVEKNKRCLVLLTGSGLKDIQSVQNSIHLPAPVKPDLKELQKQLDYNKAPGQ